MLSHWRLKVNNRVVGLAGIFGVGLLPCPDCGLPLAIKVWPAAAVIWGLRYFQRRSLHNLNQCLVHTETPPDVAEEVMSL